MTAGADTGCNLQVGNIAPLGECFTTQFLRPAPFSPLK
jgi:hypothetical protein